MFLASRVPEAGPPSAEACPLYCLWYYALSLLQPARVRLYYLSWSLLAALLPASLYLLIRALGGTRTKALLAAFVLLTSAFVDIWPYPTHPATPLLAPGALAARRAPPLAWSLGVVGGTPLP